MINNKLNPGSKEAINKGCKCPVLDNNHGEGFGGIGDDALFYMSGDCPIHTTTSTPHKES